MMVSMMDENSFFSKYLKYGWILLALVACGTAFLVFKERKEGKKSELAALDFKEQKTLAFELSSKATTKVETLSALESILSRHPELHPILDAPLALAFLASSNNEKGLPLLENQLKRSRTLPIDPVLLEFTEVSLLIEKGEKEMATQRAKELEEKLEKSGQFSHLRVYNLLRLAVLDQNPSLLEKARTLPNSELIISYFKEGNCELKDLFNSSVLIEN